MSSLKAFLTRFSEFADEPRQGDREVIAATLKAAEQELNEYIWGQLYEEGVLYLAADKLTRTAIGERFRPEGEAISVYGQEFERLARIVSMGLSDGVNRGFLASDPKPQVYIPPLAEINVEMREKRILPDVTFSARAAGAIHEIEIRGTITF